MYYDVNTLCPSLLTTVPHEVRGSPMGCPIAIDVNAGIINCALV